MREALATDPGELLASVELLVSELVTNAVIHASTAPRVVVQMTPSTVRVEVHDDDPTLPQPLPFDIDRQGGRGLFIIESMASRWGAESCGTGKRMWFELSREVPA